MDLRVLSIDPGLINFAWCSVRLPVNIEATWQDIVVEDMSVQRLSSRASSAQSYNTLMSQIQTFLQQHFANKIFDVVLIEHPNVGKKIMHAVCAAVGMYFLETQDLKVFYMTPTLKLKHTVPATGHDRIYDATAPLTRVPSVLKKTYAKRKRLSVQLATLYLQRVTVSRKTSQRYLQSRKQDDMSDALLQSMAIIRLLSRR